MLRTQLDANTQEEPTTSKRIECMYVCMYDVVCTGMSVCNVVSGNVCQNEVSTTRIPKLEGYLFWRLCPPRLTGTHIEVVPAIAPSTLAHDPSRRQVRELGRAIFVKFDHQTIFR